MEYFCSRLSAYFISRSLRATVLSVASLMILWSSFFSPVSMSVLRTYCWVRVEAPWREPPALLETRARTMPVGSTPWCW